MWGLQNTQWNQADPAPNHAVVLGTDGTVSQVAHTGREQAERGAVALPDHRGHRSGCQEHDRCRTASCCVAATRARRRSSGRGTGAAGSTPGRSPGSSPVPTRTASFFLCTPAPQPAVARVLVVSGTPMLLTDQTLEALDPTTFRSTAIAYHPSLVTYGY